MASIRYSQLREIHNKVSQERQAIMNQQLEEKNKQKQCSYAMHTPKDCTSRKVGSPLDSL